LLIYNPSDFVEVLALPPTNKSVSYIKPNNETYTKPDNSNTRCISYIFIDAPLSINASNLSVASI